MKKQIKFLKFYEKDFPALKKEIARVEKLLSKRQARSRMANKK